MEAEDNPADIGIRNELKQDILYSQKAADELRARNDELTRHLGFLEGRGNDLTAFAKETQVGNSPPAKTSALDILAKFHQEFPDLARDLEQRGIVRKLLIGGEVFPEDSRFTRGQVLGLAYPDGRVWVDGNPGRWGRGTAADPLWEHHSTSSYGLTSADGQLSTFLHEIGHQYHYNDHAEDFSGLNSGGPGTGGEKLEELFGSARRNDRLITKYAGTDKYEYFAESFVAALRHPAQLKLRDPRMYSFMKRFVADKGIAKLP